MAVSMARSQEQFAEAGGNSGDGGGVDGGDGVDGGVPFLKTTNRP
jgi:hypothetical protein